MAGNVTLLPPQQTFGSMLAQGLGTGIGTGIQQAFQEPRKMSLQKLLKTGLDRQTAELLVGMPAAQQGQAIGKIVQETQKKAALQKQFEALRGTTFPGADITQQPPVPQPQVTAGIEPTVPGQQPLVPEAGVGPVVPGQQPPEQLPKPQAYVGPLSPEEEQSIRQNVWDMNAQSIAAGTIKPEELIKQQQEAVKDERNRRTKEESAQRKYVLKNIDRMEEQAKASKNKRRALKQIKKLVSGGDIRTGPWRQALKLMGLEELGQSKTSEVVQKLMEGVNLATLPSVVSSGRVTAKIWENVAKTNPNLLQRPEAIQNIADLVLLNEKSNALIVKEVKRLKREGPRVLPLDILDQAEQNVKAKQKELGQKQADLMERISDDLESAQQGAPQQRQTQIQVTPSFGASALNPITKEPVAPGTTIQALGLKESGGKWIKI